MDRCFYGSLTFGTLNTKVEINEFALLFVNTNTFAVEPLVAPITSNHELRYVIWFLAKAIQCGGVWRTGWFLVGGGGGRGRRSRVARVGYWFSEVRFVES